MTMTTSSYFISTDKSLLNIESIYDFLSNRSYWAKGRTRETVEKSIQHSLCFGMFNQQHQQAGFARVITDYALFAWLLDVVIFEEHRGHGLGKMLIRHIINHEELKNVRRWMLGTRDAHGLYEQFGFTSIADPHRLMEKFNISKS